ncbi:cell wall-binding repeat-containing protein [Desulfosporosinus sp. SB140]|uniref:cell wall-binding repeat-containing protein n=1 Tax=Desulfosporosinus paludis TaxID=3115649 RepID=UPI00388E5C4D
MRKKVLIIFPFLIILFLTSIGTAYASQIPTLNRLAGYDRYETASQIAKTGWLQSDYAMLAYGENYPDALAAVPLAQKFNAPILLTDKDSLNPKTNTVLQDLKVKTVYIIGGTAVISTNVEDQLTKAGYSVKRIAGQDKYDTAIKIAEELGDVKEVAVTTGDDYADALSIGPIAAEKQMPIILVPKADITSSIQSYINSKTITKSYVIGDQSLISDNVVSKFPNPERILGQNKYDRNIAVLNRFTDSYQHDKLCLATGENFADALAGAVYAAKNNGAVVLVKGELPDSTRNFLKTGNSPSSVTVFGGEAVVPSPLVQGVFNSAEALDFGSINGQTYTNKYFGITITIPENWLVADNEKLTQKISTNKNVNVSNSQDASSYNEVYLLFTNKYALGKENNQLFQMVADKIDSSIKNSDDYLNKAKKDLDSSAFKFVYPKDVYTENIGGVDFKVLEVALKINDSKVVYQKLYATVQKGYGLAICLTYDSNDDITDLNQIVQSIKFN